MMNNLLKSVVVVNLLLVLVAASGCSPKVGSERWCEALKGKPKGDWSANEAADFATHCIFKVEE